jgi:hypothetical protein
LQFKKGHNGSGQISFRTSLAESQMLLLSLDMLVRVIVNLPASTPRCFQNPSSVQTGAPNAPGNHVKVEDDLAGSESTAVLVLRPFAGLHFFLHLGKVAKTCRYLKDKSRVYSLTSARISDIDQEPRQY